jgi:hypothetical protein
MSTYRFPLASEKKVPAYVGDQSFSKSLNAEIELLRDHKKADVSKAVAYGKRAKLYPLSQAAMIRPKQNSST